MGFALISKSIEDIRCEVVALRQTKSLEEFSFQDARWLLAVV